ncbi:hypothetical protein [Hydrogenophaga crocea]|uniref:Uncharacterized protein n=1 Tax=Hydrogenophaga crocea TaxID=2716225 RepID=A0A6G8IEZ4_9BURK|nr:hypothetical protein [Hydrogenophaga crocea]QIM51596.1 hypothetical protein G9Q37_05310 [Hydrogenophaga crocea]
MSNLPPGVSYYSPSAPWNAPDTTMAEVIAREQVTGANADLTCETFSEWVATFESDLTPTLHKPTLIYGAVSNPELLKVILSNKSDELVLAAVKELRARYLADGYTQKVIEGLVSEYMEAA